MSTNASTDIPPQPPRAAERWLVFLGFASAAQLAAIIGLLFMLLNIPGQIWNSALNEPVIGTGLNAQVCGNWATFVLDQNKNGLSAAQIENVWKVTTAQSGVAQATPITTMCGTIPDILAAAGRN